MLDENTQIVRRGFFLFDHHFIWEEGLNQPRLALLTLLRNLSSTWSYLYLGYSDQLLHNDHAYNQCRKLGLVATPHFTLVEVGGLAMDLVNFADLAFTPDPLWDAPLAKTGGRLRHQCTAGEEVTSVVKTLEYFAVSGEPITQLNVGNALRRFHGS